MDEAMVKQIEAKIAEVEKAREAFKQAINLEATRQLAYFDGQTAALKALIEPPAPAEAPAETVPEQGPANE